MSTETQPSIEFDYEWEYSASVPTLLGLFTLIAVLGWMITIALTVIHTFAIPAIPSDAPVQGSIEVITSQWGYIFGVPLATLGAVYYLATTGLALWWFDTRHPLIIKILTPITASGVLFSAYFVWLQLFPIGEICPFCMMSAAATVLLFGLELIVLRKSSTPALSAMANDVGGVLRETNLGAVLFPVLMGLVTIAAIYMVPLLPLPDPVPFA